MPDASAVAAASAWLLGLAPEYRAAAGELEIIHFLQNPDLDPVPGAPEHCRQVLIWQRRLVPALDLAAWLRKRSGAAPAPAPHMAAIAAYQDQPGGTPHYGALLLSELPRQISVSDDQACEMPGQPAAWSEVALACFEYENLPVPVLDLRRIFSAALN